MKANAVRFACAALVAVGAPFPASGQYFPPVMIIVPAGSELRRTPKPAPKPPPDKPKSTATHPRRRSRLGIIKAGHSCQISRRRERRSIGRGRAALPDRRRVLNAAVVPQFVEPARNAEL